MLKRWMPLVTALAIAAIATPTVLLAKGKKSDAEKMKENRDKVREKYESKDEKAGFTFYDLAYWVDVEDLEDSRWSKSDIRDAKHDRGLQLNAKWENAAAAVPGMSIQILVFKFKYYDQKGNSRQPYSYPFDNLGESVSTDDWEGLLNGFYEDWKRGAKDLIEDQCQDPKKFRGVPKMWAAAVGTDEQRQSRIRREWYAWPDGKQIASYIVQVTYGEPLLGNEGLLEKGPEFVKNIKELKDKRVEWE